MVAVAGLMAPIAFVGCATSDNETTQANKRTAGQYIDDKVLIQRVRAALGDSEVYKFPDVKVQTYRGTVQLTGFVTSPEQKQRAEEIARSVNGVYNIQNDIMMKSDTERVRGTTDAERWTTNTTTTITTNRVPNTITVPTTPTTPTPQN